MFVCCDYRQTPLMDQRGAMQAVNRVGYYARWLAAWRGFDVTAQLSRVDVPAGPFYAIHTTYLLVNLRPNLTIEVHACI